MDSYHASTYKYEVDEIIKASVSSNTKYYDRANTALDIGKPQCMAGRDSSLYVTNDESLAYYFIKKQYPKTTCYVYKVSVDVITHPHPFAVVHQIDSRIQNDKDFSVLVSEYWNPQQKWCFLEYLVPEIKILEVIPLESLDADTAAILYSLDVLKAEKL